MKEWDDYWRILQWNQLADSDFAETPEIAERCRTAWQQIAKVIPSSSQLPSEFVQSLRALLHDDPIALELLQDDRRINLCVSDLRDYLQLIRR